MILGGHGGQPMAEQRRLRLARRLGPEGKSKSVLKPIDGVAGRVLKTFDGKSRSRGASRGVGSQALNCTLQLARTSLAAPIGQPRPYPPTSHPAMHHMPPGNASHAKTAPAPSRRLSAMRPRPGAAGLPARPRRRRTQYSPRTEYLMPPRSPVKLREHGGSTHVAAGGSRGALGHHAARAVDIGGSSTQWTGALGHETADRRSIRRWTS